MRTWLVAAGGATLVLGACAAQGVAAIGFGGLNAGPGAGGPSGPRGPGSGGGEHAPGVHQQHSFGALGSEFLWGGECVKTVCECDADDARRCVVSCLAQHPEELKSCVAKLEEECDAAIAALCPCTDFAKDTGEHASCVQTCFKEHLTELADKCPRAKMLHCRQMVKHTCGDCFSHTFRPRHHDDDGEEDDDDGDGSSLRALRGGPAADWLACVQQCKKDHPEFDDAGCE